MSKEILGLDLGTTSIGFAHVIENKDSSKSEIKQIGVRIIQYDNFDKVDKSGKVSESKNPENDFASGRGLSPNAGRTLKRGARRTLDRYQLRRENLIDALKKANIITGKPILAENGKHSTHETWRLRATSVTSKIEKEELARVFLAINKKRGYKSSRKAKNPEEGQAVDGMAIAKRLYEENLTPGQLAYQLLKEGKKVIPDFYRSDLHSEFDKVWNYQKQFYPEVFTDDFKKELEGKGQRATSASFWKTYNFNTAENKGKRDEKKLHAYEWRSKAVSEKLEKEEAAFVITEINNNLNNSSGYLGAISDRSKELYFNKETVGQKLFKQLQQNPHNRLKNQVFYRQDYMDEFEAIWAEQAKHHTELTDDLKVEIRDITIFYQRKLKSQKGLVSFCEFESKEILVDEKKKIIGLKVAPKSSPLFQEFKIWQRLNDVLVRKKGSKKRKVKKTEEQASLFETEKEVFVLDLATRQQLFEELNLKGNLSSTKIIELLGQKPAEWEMNFSELEGNRTNAVLYNAFLKILEIEGYDEDLLKLSDEDDINVAALKTSASEIKNMVNKIFGVLEINTAILDFDSELEGKAFEQQPSYQLWHLLYSAEDDMKQYSEEDILLYGNDNIGLKKQLCSKFGFKPEHSKILVNVTFADDYGNLSAKAMRKILLHLKDGFAYGGRKDKPEEPSACELAGYRHSAASLTKEEIENRSLKDKLELLKKNSLRNPVVEKILNQMVNVVNALVEKNSEKDEAGNIIKYFHFDEIRIELSRELKKNAKERAEMTTNINGAKIAHEKIFQLLQSEFGLKNPTRNDIIRYRLYEELKNNGYKDLYTDTYIPPEILFSKQIDIEHIIPQSKLFDDSFSNKTITYRKDNLDKGNQTAYDYIDVKFGDDALTAYQQRIENLFEQGKKSKDDPSAGISKAKYQKLLKKESDIGDGFIERDLRESQYIAKKAKNMLFEIARNIVPTTGSITDRLREDWDLINVMKELNLPKYKALGMTEIQERKFGQKVEIIKDWTKRNDHRHHAMDALTVAFTKHSHIQYLNHLNARRNEKNKLHGNIIGIENKELHKEKDDKGNYRWVFNEPIPNFRHLAKEHLENVFVSHKAKNKVVTKNKNKTKSKGGEKTIIELTPRGQLHKETVYGKYHYYESKEEKIGTKFDLETINKVANPAFKTALLQRLSENNNDPKKAFGGKNALSKNSIYLNPEKTETMPEKVKLVWLEEDYSIRKDVTPDLKIDKVIDIGIRNVLQTRLNEFKGNPKEAFTNLDKNPIWINKEKGISVKRVKISGVKNAEVLHRKKDHLGKNILDKDGKLIPVDFVSTGNNHHVAIYRDASGKLQENVVSFYEAVERVNQSLPVIDKSFRQDEGWSFLFSMKQNEYFVFPSENFDPSEIDLLNPFNNKLISPHLFRVQKFSKVSYGNADVRDYVFRHHLETSVMDQNELKDVSFRQIKSLSPLEKIIKVRINHIGQIVKVGE